MVRHWGVWSASRILRCADRAEVRRFLAFAANMHTVPPRLEKVKAHNEEWLRLEHPMAVGNDRADALAKIAATDPDVPQWPPPEAAFRDPVEFFAAGNTVVEDVPAALPAALCRGGILR